MTTMITQDVANKTSLKVLTTPAAGPSLAQDYFAAKRACETDPSDVWSDLQDGQTGFVMLDARSREAYMQGHVPGAISLPHAEIDEESIAALPSGTVAVTYCWGPGCNAGTKAALKLAGLGIPVKEMIGGIEYWLREGYPVETGEGAR